MNTVLWIILVFVALLGGFYGGAHSHNPPQYSHIAGLLSRFYAHIGAGRKVFHPLMSKLMWFQTFCPWHLLIK